ncbi:MAG: von Willebrand factor type A domain-containing protein [Bacteroidota bacterium]
MKRTTSLLLALGVVLGMAIAPSTANTSIHADDCMTSLRGKVTDETGEPVILGNVVLKQNGIMITGAQTDFDGFYSITNIDPGTYEVEFTYVGLQPTIITGVVVKEGKANTLDVVLTNGVNLEEVVVIGYEVPLIEQDNTTQGGDVVIKGSRSDNTVYWIDGVPVRGNLVPQSEISTKKRRRKFKRGKKLKKNQVQSGKPAENTEQFTTIVENQFLATQKEAVSTFSIDVDRASYTIVRSRIQRNGNRPDPDAVRIEEMVNYFTYQYEGPQDGKPFAVATDIMDCPWKPEHYLLRIGLKGEQLEREKSAPSNLVFLLDVSGSMADENKLPLVKKSLEMLVAQLRPQDQVAIVVYAGAAGVVLPPTSGDQQATILAALHNLQAGGSTAGGAGIELAYKLAEEHLLEEGNNRVILATDGDFNVGVNSVGGLESLIEKKRKKGIFLTALGFGMGNYKDNLIEVLADKGNGNYAYIDTEQEARRVFVNNLMGTLYTIAKDVKIQLTFDSNYVKEYRLIGYENRMLAKEDFANDAKDAGELGAGHTVTALYEVVPGPAARRGPFVKTGNPKAMKLGTIALRYKKPNASKSELLSFNIEGASTPVVEAHADLQHAAAVAAFGMWLRRSSFLGDYGLDDIRRLALRGMREDPFLFREEFVALLEEVSSQTWVLEE